MRMKSRWVAFLGVVLFIIVSSLAAEDVSGEEKWATVYDRYTYKDDGARFMDAMTFVVKEIPPESSIHMVEKENKIIIYYDLGSSTLRPSEIKKLRRFTRKHISFTVKVIGYTGPLGSLRRNEVVARQRASTVSTWLKNNRVIVSTTQSKPKCCYISKDKLWKNRRVEIIYEKGGENQLGYKESVYTPSLIF
jgi:outer membrane protein OmpA-like peptidoglycan-associated protein